MRGILLRHMCYPTLLAEALVRLLAMLLAMLLASPLLANTEPPPKPSTLEMLVIPVAFFILLYIILIRPQAQKVRKQRDFIAALKVGDKVVVSGGILGVVKRIQPMWINVDVGCGVIEVLKDNVFSRESIESLMNRENTLKNSEAASKKLPASSVSNTAHKKSHSKSPKK
ncbi:MAG: preprotein translocase subunit YajC [Proteobacteria bacterium]|nr:preprotein translocase subunit YajC [Pseudomonadota bacterium]